MSRLWTGKADFNRVLSRRVRDTLKTVRRQLRRLVTNPGGAIGYVRYRRAIRRRDWAAVRALLRPLSRAALAAKDRRLLTELGQAALRLDEYQLGAELMHAGHGDAPRLSFDSKIPGTLLVRLMDTEKQGVAVGMPLAGYIRAASAHADRTVVMVERRMVPLFQRTLPEVGVVAFDPGAELQIEGPVVDAGIDDLRLAFGFDAATIERLHVPLAADRAQAETMRAGYRRGRSVPLVGISWWSSHYGKDLPTLAHWSHVLSALPAQFVSLQYGDVDDQVALLRSGDPGRLLVDPSVDQLTDMDRFASQIAALDLVISISNSGAHLAGAMGQRMILVRDDLFRRAWPYLSRKVPWYPGTTVVGKNGRPWVAVFDEIVAATREALAAGAVSR
jgi:hypothetical protein